MVAVAMQAVARAGVAGWGVQPGVLVRAREAEFCGPKAARKSLIRQDAYGRCDPAAAFGAESTQVGRLRARRSAVAVVGG